MLPNYQARSPFVLKHTTSIADKRNKVACLMNGTLSVYCFKLRSCAVVQHSMTTFINDCYDIHCCSDLNILGATGE